VTDKNNNTLNKNKKKAINKKSNLKNKKFSSWFTKKSKTNKPSDSYKIDAPGPDAMKNSKDD